MVSFRNCADLKLWVVDNNPNMEHFTDIILLSNYTTVLRVIYIYFSINLHEAIKWHFVMEFNNCGIV